MWYSVIFGVSIIIGSTLGYPLSGAIVGIVIASIAFLYVKFGSKLAAVTKPSTENKSGTAKKSDSPSDTSKKRVTDAFGWGLRVGATVIILAITGWVINALIPNRVTEPIFGDEKPAASGVSVNGKPAGQKWDLYDEVDTCSVGWNAKEGGPWCEAIELPPGTYRIMPRFTEMWQHANVSRHRVLGYHSIPARGIMLGEIFDKTDRSYREFLRMAPLGGNMWFGRMVVRVGDKLMYDPYEHGWFTITEPTKMLVGVNIPPLEEYVSMDTGKLPFDIERLRQ